MSKPESIDPVPHGPPELNEEDFDLLIALRSRIATIAELAERLLVERELPAPRSKELRQLACQIYDARRLRDKLVEPRLMGEPGWDMMLALYCLPGRGFLLTVTGLSHSANVPAATGARWQKALRAAGLIESGPQGVDMRLKTLRLTVTGRAMMDRILTRIQQTGR